MRAVWLVLVLSAVCAAAETPQVGHAWEPLGYQGFAESVDALVGPDAVDCGFLNMLDKELTTAARSRAYQCIQLALKKMRPFKFGTLRIPIDSYAYEVLAFSPQGELWRLTFDLMLTDDESGQQWNQVCKSVSIDRRSLLVRGENCVNKPDGRLDP